MKPLRFLGLALALFNLAAFAEDKWTIHEWGTFTSLQNESGDALSGVNTDDEPVPDFVHRIGYDLVQRTSQMPSILSKGVFQCHPDVTMRLETPVIYFHPPKSQTKPEDVNVTVKFRGGWLTEFFPDANPVAPGLIVSRDPTNHLINYNASATLQPNTESKLEWDNLEIGGAQGTVPDTSSHVWISPRAVQTASVKASNGEGEKFIFYRGIAHIDAPLKVSHDPNTGDLLFRSHLTDLPGDKPLAVRSMWLVDIRQDGKIAFRTLPSVTLDHNSKKILAHTSPGFAASDFSSANLARLKDSLQSALVADGLFTDEAQAMLNTWELSYFKSAGLRVFFLVPRAWTDSFLPLQTSLAADINRAMVGRIELITPEQRKTLTRIGQFSKTRIQMDALLMRLDFAAPWGPSSKDLQPVYSGEKNLSSAVSVPSTYQAYLDLGRFRQALILDEAKHHPTAGLTNFIATYRLQPILGAREVAASPN